MIFEFYLAASLPLFFLLIFLEGGQRRILAFLDPWQFRRDVGYQIMRVNPRQHSLEDIYLKLQKEVRP